MCLAEFNSFEVFSKILPCELPAMMCQPMVHQEWLPLQSTSCSSQESSIVSESSGLGHGGEAERIACQVDVSFCPEGDPMANGRVTANNAASAVPQHKWMDAGLAKLVWHHRTAPVGIQPVKPVIVLGMPLTLPNEHAVWLM